MKKSTFRAGALLLLAGFFHLPPGDGRAEAAIATAAASADLDCDGGRPAIGYLGIPDVEGSFSFDLDAVAGTGAIRFYAEPEVVRVDPEGPSREKVKAGDVIVAVDGWLVTTEEGSRLFTNPPVGREVTIELRRGGRNRRVVVVTEAICPEDTRYLGSRIPADADPVSLALWGFPGIVSPAAVPPVPRPAPPRRAPHVWLGMGLRCSIDGTEKEGNLRFTAPPTIFQVRPGSAAEKAGLRKGDVITHVDGIPIETREGTAEAFGIRPGDEVRWTVRRKGGSREIRMVAEVPPAEEIPGDVDLTTKATLDQVRFAGTYHGTAVEVRSPFPVEAERNEATGEMYLRVGETVIRLSPAKEKKEERP